MTRKLTQLFLIFFATLTFAQAQDNPYSLKNNLYMSYGSHFGIGRVEIGNFNYGFYDIGFHFNARYNIVNITDNLSLGFDLAPEVGLYNGTLDFFSNSGNLGIHIPIMLSLNVGVGSTYDSDDNFGASFKSGIEIFTGPHLQSTNVITDKTAFMPVFQFSGRFYKKQTNKLREIYLRVGKRTEEGQSIIDDGLFVAYVGGSFFIGY